MVHYFLPLFQASNVILAQIKPSPLPPQFVINWSSSSLRLTTQRLDGMYKVLSKLVPLQLGSTVVVLLCAGNNYDFLQFY